MKKASSKYQLQEHQDGTLLISENKSYEGEVPNIQYLKGHLFLAENGMLINYLSPECRIQ